MQLLPAALADLADRLLEAALRMVRAEAESGDYLDDRQRWAGPIVESETELGFLGATASGYIQQQTGGHYPAPLAALEVMLGAAGLPLDAACDQEAEGMAGLFGTPVNRALINVFFLTDHNKKDQGVDRPGVAAAARSDRSASSAPASWAPASRPPISAAQVPVAVTDAAEPALADGVRHVLEEVSYNKQTKGPDAERAIRFAPLLNATVSDAEIGPGRSGHRGGGRKPGREEEAVRPAGTAAEATTPFWRRTRRRFRSPSWPQG